MIGLYLNVGNVHVSDLWCETEKRENKNCITLIRNQINYRRTLSANSH